MKLLLSYYEPDDILRHEEYLTCLLENIRNELIEEIVVFLDNDTKIPQVSSDKVTFINTSKKITYKLFFEYCNNNFRNEICIVSNNDIIYDETLGFLNKEDLSGKLLCVTRWDINEDGTIEDYSPEYGPDKSQDTWIFQSPIDINMEELWIQLGHQGCDNRLASVAFKNGLNVCNPSNLIICKHMHSSKYRTTAGDDDKRILGQYLYIEPSDDFKTPDIYSGSTVWKDDETGTIRYKDTKTTNFVKRGRLKVKNETSNKKYETGALITGATGLVGRAVQHFLKSRKPSPFLSTDVVFLSSKDYDLRRPEQTNEMLARYKPKTVIHLAGTVGGVKANIDNPAEFYTNNIYINSNMIHFCHRHNVEKLICTLSTCVYPDKTKYPIKEEYLHLGPPHKSNFAYAYSKRMLEVQMRAYRKQYGCNFIGVIPTNIFGEHDNFDLESSHVIPAIMRKIYEAKLKNKDVILWGDGSPVRQFTYSRDIAKILIWLAENKCEYDLINIGDDEERSIQHVAEIISNTLNFSGNIIWDSSMPSGQIKKTCDMLRLKKLGFDQGEFTNFGEAITSTAIWFEENYQQILENENQQK